MKRLVSLLRWIYEDFAPIVVFLVAERFTDLRGAILTTLLFVVADVAGRLIRQARIDRLYWFSFASTVSFGIVDLALPTPTLFRYESVATNLLTAGFFAITLWTGTPLIQELAEKTMDEEKRNRPDVQHYLRLLTGVWAGYFVFKAMVYGYVAYFYSLDEAIAFRALFGTLSLVAMLIGERLLRPQLFPLLRRWGYLAEVAPLQ